MCAKRLSVTMLGVLILCLATVTTAQIVIDQEPSDLERREYRVKIDSTAFGAPHTVGIFGRGTKAEARIRFDGNRRGPDIYSLDLRGGMRIVCVWDASGYIQFFDTVLVDRSGTLRIPAALAMRREGAGDGASPARSGLGIE